MFEHSPYPSQSDEKQHNDKPPCLRTMDPQHSNMTSSLRFLEHLQAQKPSLWLGKSCSYSHIPCLKSIPLVTRRTGSFGMRSGMHYTPRSFHLPPISLQFPRRTSARVGVMHHQATHPFCGLHVCSKGRTKVSTCSYPMTELVSAHRIVTYSHMSGTCLGPTADV